MPTVFGPVNLPPKLSQSDYAQSCELIAPGIVALVDAHQAQTSPWWDSLVELLPSLNATLEQRGLLIKIADSAAKGLPAPAVATKQDNLGKMLTYVSVGGLLLNLFS